jgi:hypothetical protein
MLLATATAKTRRRKLKERYFDETEDISADNEASASLDSKMALAVLQNGVDTMTKEVDEIDVSCSASYLQRLYSKQ